MNDKRLALGKTALYGAAAALGLAMGWAGCSSEQPAVDGPSGGSQGSGGAQAGPTGTGGGTGGGGGDAGGAGGADQCPGAKECGGVCTNTDFDPQNCGDCGNACPMGQVCSLGKCAITCLGGTKLCGEKCVNPDNDPAHCGDCEQACAQGLVCSGGKCVLTCEQGGGVDCGGICVDVNTDKKNCGACGMACTNPDEVCVGGKCSLECVGGSKNCGGICVDTNTDKANCGACGQACKPEEVCSLGACAFTCIGGTKDCSGLCVDVNTDPKNCGACGMACKTDEVCNQGTCTNVCGVGLTKCGMMCVDTMTNDAHCGGCDLPCKATADCKAGVCVECDSNVTDCDGDGWLVADGDCCDKVGSCGLDPAQINPGAVEVVGNGIDDNCNGKVDLVDLQDTVACDANLASNSQIPGDYAKAIGICRTTTENPAQKKDKTWGLIEAKFARADGTPLSDFRAVSIRNGFGSVEPGALEGQKLIVLSSGIAADATQTMPGPNGGAPGNTNVSTTHSPASSADISACNDPACIKDWFTKDNPPLKKMNELPVAPNCGMGNAGNPTKANDSVMLKLRLRAPTNAKAFSFNSYFISAEYPEYVCTNYNDQFIALVDTPVPTTPIPNPIDKNLMIYNDGVAKWPVGINVANGTDLFRICNATEVMNMTCSTSNVNSKSCSLGPSQLTGTGFEKPTNSACYIGGGTFWLTTSGNVVPGEIVELRIVVWDVFDSAYDSVALIDGFDWLKSATVPGSDG
jgi:hypothetical protein